ncbi:hypothetical protein OE88DRAFT_1737056 [Heliocybe sulcata]|uniref:Uncharacterized protein n=1 Tax=Heliocybe sulcata TaxID=5364 RepID=A0A5C3MWW0_9AGAM|nr:hypothetical protein OE88DRAFT_1737056 [Heliocybe sulcata]
MPRSRRVALPPPPKPGPGDLWLSTVKPDDYSRHPKNTAQEVYIEMYVVRHDNPEPSTYFLNPDLYQLYVSAYVPLNSGVPDQHRISPVVLLEKWEGLKNDYDAPSWILWVPNVTKSFVESRAVTAIMFGFLSTHGWNEAAADQIWTWAGAISIGTEAEGALQGLAGGSAAVIEEASPDAA